MAYSQSLTDQAKAYAQVLHEEFLQTGQAVLNHSSDASRPDQGENLFFWSDPNELATTTRAAEWFYNEVNLWDPNNNVFSPVTGHFTAMVWKGVCEVGCATVEQFLVCRYSPQPNIFGQFDANVMAKM